MFLDRSWPIRGGAADIYTALKGAVYTVWIFICICMSLRVFLFARKMKFWTKTISYGAGNSKFLKTEIG